MLKEISQEDFYWRSAGEFQDAVGGLKLHCSTKTPCVLSSRERSTEAREQYYQEFIRAVKNGRLRPQYCFAWPPTVELVAATLFSSDDQECQQQREQLQEVKSLADQHLLDLRWCPSIAFDSGIVGPKIAMIHRKDPAGLYTVSVEFATDDDSDRRSAPFIAFTEQLKPLDDAGFRRLIEKSKIKCFTPKVVSYVDKVLRQLGADLLELDRIEAATLEALNVGVPPKEASLRALLDRLLPGRQKTFRDLCARIIAAGLDRYMGIMDSAETILTKSSVKLVPLQGPRQVKVNFTSTGVEVNDNDPDNPYNSAWRMVEYFIWKNNPVHWREGHLFYPRWQRKGVGNGRKQFREKLNTYANNLREKYGIQLDFKGDKLENADYWELIKHNLSTNIPEAEKCYEEAAHLFQKGEFTHAKDELRKALDIYPNHLQSYLLLTKCYEEQDFEKVSLDEINNVLWPCWDYLNKKSGVLEDIGHVASKRNDKELRLFLSKLESDPIYSELREHTNVLRKWLNEGVFSEDYKLVLELQELLKAIVAFAADDSVKREKVAAFCQIACVKEVLFSMGEIWPVLIGTLFYSKAENGLQYYRLEAFAKQNFKSVKDFQRYFRSILESLKEAMIAKGSLPETTAFEKIYLQIKQVNKLAERLGQELSKEITDEDLIEEIEAKWDWEPAHIKKILFYRKKWLVYYGDMSFFEEKHTDNKDIVNE